MSTWDWDERIGSGNSWEDKITKRLRDMGWAINKHGQEDQFSKGFLKHTVGDGSRMLRYQPDRVGTFNGRVALIEIKSTITNTPNYSYERNSYDSHIALSKLQDVIVIFSEFRADFVQNLTIVKWITDPFVLEKVKGSTTPFGLIEKSSIPSLDEFMAIFYPPSTGYAYG